MPHLSTVDPPLQRGADGSRPQHDDDRGHRTVDGWNSLCSRCISCLFGLTALLAFLVARLWKKLEKWPWQTSIQQGLAPVSIGLPRRMLHQRREVRSLASNRRVVAVGVLPILLQYKINPALLVLGGAVVGVLSSRRATV